MQLCKHRAGVGARVSKGVAVARPGLGALAKRRPVYAVQTKEGKTEAEIATEKYGLEAGLFKALTSQEEGEGKPSRTQQAKQLLAQYGSAYLITSISFAIVSFTACYAAVSAGVDVGGLLTRLGLPMSDTSQKVGTFAIAYAAHKALSPVRFPPTVALTPVVAQWVGKKKGDAAGGSDDAPSSKQE